MTNSFEPGRTIQLPNILLYNSVKEMVEEGHTVTFRVKGYSMTPFLINERDSVEVGPFQTLSKGDIVLGKTADNHIVLHRIISVNNGFVTLMGEGNLKGTENILTRDIAGIVKSALRDGEKVDLNSSKWLLLSTVWSFLLPVRRILLFFYRKIF